MGMLFITGLVLIGVVLLIALVSYLAYEAQTGITWKKVMLLLLLLAAAPFFTWWTLHVAVPEISRLTKRDVIVEASSPDEAYTAVVYRRQADGPKHYRTFVSLAKSGKRANDAGAVFTVKESPEVGVRWLNGRTLQITARLAIDPTMKNELDISKAEQRWEDVTIEYVVIKEGAMLTDPAKFVVPSSW